MSIAPVITAIDRLLEVATARRGAKAKARLQQQLAAKVRAAFKTQAAALAKRLPALETAFTVAEAYGRKQTDVGIVWLVRDRIPMDGDLELLREAAQPDWEPLWDATAADTLDVFLKPLTDFIQKALEAGSVAAIADLQVDSSFALAHPEAVAYAKKRAAEMVSAINDTTRDMLQTQITNAIEGGQSYGELAASIRDMFDGFTTPAAQGHIRDRAELVAVTEIGEAYSWATHDVAQRLSASGLEMEHAWLTAEDDKVSDECQANEDAGWIPLDDTFPSGDAHPLEHPGCRCSELTRRKADA